MFFPRLQKAVSVANVPFNDCEIWDYGIFSLDELRFNLLTF